MNCVTVQFSSKVVGSVLSPPKKGGETATVERLSRNFHRYISRLLGLLVVLLLMPVLEVEMYLWKFRETSLAGRCFYPPIWST